MCLCFVLWFYLFVGGGGTVNLQEEWMPLPLATKWELFEAELANTDSYLPILNKALAELEDLIHCEEVKRMCICV